MGGGPGGLSEEEEDEVGEWSGQGPGGQSFHQESHSIADTN